MIRYGIISEVDYSKGLARVNFDEIDIVSDWLALPKKINSNVFFKINAQVAVLSENEYDEILHEVPTEDEKPPTWASKDVEGFEFKDGTNVTYDNSTKKITIDSTGEIILNCTKLTVNGTVEATGDVKAGAISLQNHVHPAVTTATIGATAVLGTVTVSKP